jgi:atypical dual specificity phosphatase
MFSDRPLAAAGSPHAPLGFRWLLPGRLAGMPHPGLMRSTHYDLDAIRSLGVSHLISLTEKTLDTPLAREFGINWISCAIPEMAPPTLSQAVFLCRLIDEVISKSQAVAVHCLAGLGRTGTVLAAYRIWREAGSIDGTQALAFVRRIESGWIQSDAQVHFLEEFALIAANQERLPSCRTLHEEKPATSYD